MGCVCIAQCTTSSTAMFMFFDLVLKWCMMSWFGGMSSLFVSDPVLDAECEVLSVDHDMCNGS